MQRTGLEVFKQKSLFETEPIQELSNHKLSFKDSQELLDWINNDVNAAKQLFEWHDAVRVAYDDTISSHNRLLVEKVEEETIREALKAEVTELKAEIEDLKVDKEELIATVERKNVEDQGVIKYYQDQLRESTAALSEAASASHPRLSFKLPDPPKFTDGMNPNIVDWLSLMKDKLRINHDHFPTDKAQLSYAKNRLSGDAAKLMAPRTRKGATKPFSSADELMEALFKTYGDPDRRTTTVKALKSILPPENPAISTTPSCKSEDPSPRSYPSLMDLPCELRMMIWDHLLVLNGDQIELCFHGPEACSARSKQFRTKHVIAILQTSRIIYQETMLTFYRYNTLYFKYSSNLEYFLKYVNPKCLQFIGSIRVKFVGANPIQTFKVLLLCEQLRHLQLDTYGGVFDGKEWHERHSVRSRGMKKLLKLRGLISVKVTRFADEEDELTSPTDLREYETLCTALEVLKQPKALQVQLPICPDASKSTLVKRRQPKKVVKGKRNSCKA